MMQKEISKLKRTNENTKQIDASKAILKINLRKHKFANSYFNYF